MAAGATPPPSSPVAAGVAVVDAGGPAGRAGRPAALVGLEPAPGSQTGEGEGQAKQGPLRLAGAAVAPGWDALGAAAAEMWAFARADPRKPVFAAKVGLALALISLLIFLRAARDIVSHSVWAILTIVVVFEFSIDREVANQRLLPLLALELHHSCYSSYGTHNSSTCCSAEYGGSVVSFMVLDPSLTCPLCVRRNGSRRHTSSGASRWHKG